MRILARTLALAALLGLAPASAHAATNTYSSRAVARPLLDAGRTELGLAVRHRGPVSHVSVFVRLDHPAGRQLTLSLVSPSGRVVVLSARRGNGANYGSGAGCSGRVTVFDDDYGDELDEADSPFVEGPYSPEGRLQRLYGEEAAGRWRLRVDDAQEGGKGVLRCWKLELSRAVVDTVRRRSDGVLAELSYVERRQATERVRFLIRRRGATLLDAPLGAITCEGCPSRGSLLTGSAPVTVRDLDANGEPEVLLDLFTGGAHCCSYTLIFRHRAERRDYRRTVGFWGNASYRLTDHDRDGTPELTSADDRFAYQFVPYAATAEPVQIWRLERGRLVDRTRAYPAVVRAHRRGLWLRYLDSRAGPYPEVRGVLAAYLAESYLLGEQDAGWKRLEGAVRRGEVGRERSEDGWPGGKYYLGKLRLFLRHAGYAPDPLATGRR